jgi:hypothetical protein
VLLGLRYLILGSALTVAPIGIVVTAPPAEAIATTPLGPPYARRAPSGVRTACQGPRLRSSPIRASTTGIAIPAGISTSVGIRAVPVEVETVPVEAVASDHVEQRRHDPSTTR